MKVPVVSALIALSALASARAQSVSPFVAATSGGNSDDGVSLNWTVGQAASDVFVRPGFAFTFGFQQPNIEAISLTTVVSPYAFSVFPNPFAGQVHVIVEHAPEPLIVSLYDLGGRIIDERELHAGTSIFTYDMNPYAPGSYYLRVKTTSGETREFYKLLKTP